MKTLTINDRFPYGKHCDREIKDVVYKDVSYCNWWMKNNRQYQFDDELKKIIVEQSSLVADCREERKELSRQKKLKKFYDKRYNGGLEEHLIEIGINGH